MAEPVEEIEDVLRRHVAHLIKLGVKRKAIADQIERNQSWVTRWLDKQKGAGELSVRQLQRLFAYVHKMAVAIEEIERFKPAAQESPPHLQQQSGKKRSAS